MRYFAGGAEIAFCGHATLAAADAVLEAAGKVDLVTSSGKTVAATRSSDGAVELRLAASLPAGASLDAVAAATAALGGVEARRPVLRRHDVGRRAVAGRLREPRRRRRGGA